MLFVHRASLPSGSGTGGVAAAVTATEAPWTPAGIETRAASFDCSKRGKVADWITENT
jgi:hypothetical protein